MLLKNGITDINTEDPDEITLAKDDLKSLIDRQREALDQRLHEPPGGQRVGAPDVVGERDVGPVVLAEEGVGPEVLGFWFPEDGRAPSATTMIAIPESAKNPCSRTTS